MALDTEGVRRALAFDPAAKSATRSESTRLPMAYFGKSVTTLATDGQSSSPLPLPTADDYTVDAQDLTAPPAPVALPTAEQYASLRTAIGRLSVPFAQRLMDYLEWDADRNAQPTNGRFGTRGMELLSQLTPDSPQWAVLQTPLAPEHKQTVIDAAKRAVSENYPGGLLWQVHGGDQIFEPSDLTDWLGRSSPVDGVIGPFNQNVPAGNCWLFSALMAVARDPDGAQMLKEMIRVDAEGNYQVTFRGDPYGSGKTIVTVPRQAIDDHAAVNASGDLDARVIEEAVRMYYPKVAVGATGAADNWADESYNFTLLTGLTPELAGNSWDFAEPTHPVVSREVLHQLAARDPDGALSMTFTYQRDDGIFHSYGVENIDFAADTVYFRDPYNSGQVSAIAIAELLAKPYLRVASVAL